MRSLWLFQMLRLTNQSDWQRCHLGWAQNAEGTNVHPVMSQPVIRIVCPIYGLQVQPYLLSGVYAFTWDCFYGEYLPPSNMDTVASFYQSVRNWQRYWDMTWNDHCGNNARAFWQYCHRQHNFCEVFVCLLLQDTKRLLVQG